VVNVVNTFGANGVLARYSVNFAPSGDYERFYAFDPQGSCAEMIAGAGSSGTLLQSNTYDAFGNQTASTSAYGDAYAGYGSQWGYFADNTGTGLELLGHRYYDEVNGRFVNRDPIGYDGGIDVYEYSSDSPTDECDWTGLSPEPAVHSGSQTALSTWQHMSALGISLAAGMSIPSCAQLKAAFKAECKGLNSPVRCKGNDTPSELISKVQHFARCIRLAYLISGRCYGDKDPGHEERLQNWLTALCKCVSFANCLGSAPPK
jgi:RHS repeat-associated protein